jgi:RNA polymerase sigma factor (sigma-70 family)
MREDWRPGDWAQLLTGCTQDDPRAWRSLLETVRAVAMARAQRSYGLKREDAEDLAQQVQIRVAQHLSQVRRPLSFSRWLRRLIHHAAMDSIRQRRLILSADLLQDVESCTRPLWHEVEGTEVADPYDQAVLRADLTRALARLPALYAEPIRLHLIGGLPQNEVGQLLGRPRSTVATQIERGLDRLRRLLVGVEPGSFREKALIRRRA